MRTGGAKEEHALAGARQRAAPKELRVLQRQLHRLAQRVLCRAERPNLPEARACVLRLDNLCTENVRVYISSECLILTVQR